MQYIFIFDIEEKEIKSNISKFRNAKNILLKFTDGMCVEIKLKFTCI